jgi:hypothetical protein
MRVTTGPEPALTRSARGSARKGARPACSFAYALKGDRRFVPEFRFGGRKDSRKVLL